jgi:hypothetical protein
VAIQFLPAFRYTTRFAFQHIANYDGTSDSICLKCHRAIASSYNEDSLERAEGTHTCSEVDLLARVPPARVSKPGRRPMTQFGK